MRFCVTGVVVLTVMSFQGTWGGGSRGEAPTRQEIERRCWQVLQEASGAEGWETRWFAAHALRYLGDRRLLPFVEKLLMDPHAEVRLAAGEAALELGWAPGAAVYRDLLAQKLKADPAARAWVVGKLQDLKSVEFLLGCLQASDARVRADAAWALGEIGDLRGRETLERLSQTDPVAAVRAAASGALYRCEESPRVARLQPFLTGGDPLAAEQAVRALIERIDNRAIAARPFQVEALLRVLRHGPPRAQGWAALGLGRTKLLWLFPPLQRRFERAEGAVQVCLATALLQVRSGSQTFFDQFTLEMFKVWGAMLQACDEHYSDLWDIEHLLLGMLAVPDCHAAQILQRLGVDLSLLRRRLVERVESAEYRQQQRQEYDRKVREAPWLALPLDDERRPRLSGERVGDVFDLAAEEAKKVQRVGSEYCLLGVVKYEDIVQRDLLTDLGVSVEKVRALMQSMKGKWQGEEDLLDQ